jgi:hypothetical protein
MPLDYRQILTGILFVLKTSITCGKWGRFW